MVVTCRPCAIITGITQAAYRGAVEMHGAGAADLDAAAELASGQAQMLAHDP